MRRVATIFLLLAAALSPWASGSAGCRAAPATPGGGGGPAPGGAAPPLEEARTSASAPALLLRGRWVLDAQGAAVAPREFERGLQTSGLLFRGGELWSVGDQRAEWPGHLLRIDPATALLLGPAMKLETGEGSEKRPLFEEYRSIRNSDFEGIAADPRDPAVLYGITEDKRQWIVRVRISPGPPPRAAIEEIAPVEFPGDLRPFGDDLNYRLEGIAADDRADTLYLAWERAADGLPRIFKVPLADAAAGKTVRALQVEMDFAAVGLRQDKPRALLNLNDIQFLRRDGRPFLLALARDQERVLLLALDSGKVERTADLDFRDPEGERILWTSPEGLAVDPATGRLWIINDPDSIRGNYRRPGDAPAEGNFRAMAPLLFEAKFSAVIP